MEEIMEKKRMERIAEKTRRLMEAPTCAGELKEAAQRWLDSVGTETEAEETKAYLKELKEDIMPIEQLIGFAESEGGKAYFGADTAAGIAAHAREIQAAGARYCDCPACALVEEILAEEEGML